MRVQPQPTHNAKISIAQMVNHPQVPYTERPIPSLPVHVTFMPDPHYTPQWSQATNSQQKPRIRKKKIFQHPSPTFAKIQPQIEQNRSQQKTIRQQKPIKQQHQLRKVKSNVNLNIDFSNGKNSIQNRIDQINKQLQSHRRQRSQHYTALSASAASNASKQYNDNSLSWTKIQQKLTQSTNLIKKQEEVLNQKLPSFQKKIQANKHAITEMSNLIKSKLQQDTFNIQNLAQKMTLSESRLKTKEQQLSKINSQLLVKEGELMKNKQINRKKQLELIRLKRIEDLQNRNLQLYQSIEKKSEISRFDNLPVQEIVGVVEGECWGDQDQPKMSKFTHNQESTIRYNQQHSNTFASANNTIGEILSPLTLNEHKFYK